MYGSQRLSSFAGEQLKGCLSNPLMNACAALPSSYIGAPLSELLCVCNMYIHIQHQRRGRSQKELGARQNRYVCSFLSLYRLIADALCSLLSSNKKFFRHPQPPTPTHLLFFYKYSIIHAGISKKLLFKFLLFSGNGALRQQWDDNWPVISESA